MKKIVLGSICLALLTCGCRTSAPPNPPNPVSPARAPGQPAPAETPPQRPVVAVTERSAEFYAKRPRPLPSDAFRERVDYKSELAIRIDTNALMERIGQTKSVLPALAGAEKQQLETLSSLSESARQYLADYVRFAREFEAQQGRARTPEVVSNLKALIVAQGKSGLKVMDTLMAYIDAKHRKENPGANSSRILQLRKPYEERILSGGSVLDFPALTEFIANERAALTRQRLRDAETVRGAGSVHLRMRSSLLEPGKSAVSLHIRNYDTGQDSDVVQEPRVSFKMSEEDRRRIAAETRVNGDIAKLARDLQDGKSEIRQSLDAVAEAMRGDLKDWKTAVTNLDQLKEKLSLMVKALEKAEGVAGLDAAVKEVVQKAKATFSKAQGLAQQTRETIATITGSSDPAADPADVLLRMADRLFVGLPESVQALQASGREVAEALAALGNKLAALKAGVANGAVDLRDLVEALEPAAGATAPGTAAAITALLAETTMRYPALVEMLGTLLHKGTRLAAAANLPLIQDDPSLLDVDVLNPPEGAISLSRNIARGDVTITLDGALITRKDTVSPPEVTPVHHQEFKVEKFGLINTWSANLIFVKRLGNLGPGERTVQFTPAPSISWTLHYNPPPEPDPEKDHGPNKTWQLLYPGLGLNVSALNFRDNGVQVGVGGHATLFGDLLIAGAGYNLNESYHGTYVFLGLSIFEGLSQLGVNLPVGR